MSQTKKKDHQASSGREIVRRRRTARKGGTVCVDEAMAGWGGVKAAASVTKMNTQGCKRSLWERRVCDLTLNAYTLVGKPIVNCG